MKNNKSLGQHWLKNREILDVIAALTADTSVNLCLEIGPGLGTLTSSLFRHFDKIIAVEFDPKLAENLPKSFPGKNLEVVCQDILKYDFTKIKAPYAVAGNIPYYITSPIIEKLLQLDNLPYKVVLLIQKEVAERILDDKETILSLFVKNLADVAPGPVVKKAEFTPPPKVDSQVIVMKPHSPIIAPEIFKLIKIGFKAPRKKLIHNLSSLKEKDEIEKIFSKLGVSRDARPSDLKLQDWQNLYEEMF